MDPSYARAAISFLEAFLAWSQLQADIVGVALVGSHARDTASETSDVDLIILTLDIGKYVSNLDWLSLLGDLMESRLETWGRVQAVRAFYENGLEIEYNFTEPEWAAMPIDIGTDRVVSNGMKILYDPQGLLAALHKA